MNDYKFNNKYVKITYQSEPIGPEKIVLYLTTFDLEAYERDEKLKQIPTKEISRQFKIPTEPATATECYIYQNELINLQRNINNFIIDTYDKQLQEMKAHIEYLRNAKIVPVECSNVKNITNSDCDIHCDTVKGNIVNCNNIYCNEIKGNVVNCDKIVYK